MLGVMASQQKKPTFSTASTLPVIAVGKLRLSGKVGFAARAQELDPLPQRAGGILDPLRVDPGLRGGGVARVDALGIMQNLKTLGSEGSKRHARTRNGAGTKLRLVQFAFLYRGA